MSSPLSVEPPGMFQPRWFRYEPRSTSVPLDKELEGLGRMFLYTFKVGLSMAQVLMAIFCVDDFGFLLHVVNLRVQIYVNILRCYDL